MNLCILLFIASAFAFVFPVSAPPASGKGILSWVRACGEKIHDSFLERYKLELKEYNSLPDQEKKGLPPPTSLKLFFPADNTNAMLIKSINANKIFGMILDTEADTLTVANKSEHGNFSMLFRKMFEHETIEYERKTTKEYYIINNPALSILISGTPKQVNRLLYDIENGLTSRFIFYKYNAKPIWKDVFEEGEDYEYIFKSVSIELYEKIKPYFFDYLDNPETEIIFQLTVNQQKSLNCWFKEKLDSLIHVYGVDIDASVKRLGVINFRLAMLLSVIRKISSSEVHTNVEGLKIVCSDDDFDTAQSIIDILMYHTGSIFAQLQSKSVFKNFKQTKHTYLEKLPNSFNWQTAKQIADLLNINSKTAENYLRTAVAKGILTKKGHNEYVKVN